MIPRAGWKALGVAACADGVHVVPTGAPPPHQHASIGYEKIMRYTGLRRQDVSTATNLLISPKLLRRVTDKARPRDPQAPFRIRYSVYGLSAI